MTNELLAEPASRVTVWMAENDLFPKRSGKLWPSQSMVKKSRLRMVLADFSSEMKDRAIRVFHSS